MKKVLFATTALVVTAGVASADVTITGSAEMGILGGSRLMVGTDAGFVAGQTVSTETQFSQNVDVTFTMSGTSDNGLTFGAIVDLDESAGIAGPETGHGGATVFVSGNFGTLTMGDTDGALDWALTEAGNVGNGGSINDAETVHAGYLGAYGDGMYDGQILRYDYTMGTFGFALSVEMDDSGAQSNGVAVGARYGMAFGGGTVNFGIGYQSGTTTNGRYAMGNLATFVDLLNGGDGVDTTTTGDNTRNVGIAPTGTDIDILGLSVDVAMDNGFSAGIQYSDWDVGGFDASHTGVGVGYAMDALSIHFNYGVYDLGAGAPSINGYGLTVGYDLGGGAAIRAGYGVSDYDTVGVSNTESWSLGLTMSF